MVLLDRGVGKSHNRNIPQTDFYYGNNECKWKTAKQTNHIEHREQVKKPDKKPNVHVREMKEEHNAPLHHTSVKKIV